MLSPLADTFTLMLRETILRPEVLAGLENAAGRQIALLLLDMWLRMFMLHTAIDFVAAALPVKVHCFIIILNCVCVRLKASMLHGSVFLDYDQIG